MANKMIRWMAKKLLKQISTEARPRFLEDLKNDRNYVINIFKTDIDFMIQTYTLEENHDRKVIQINAEDGDPNAFFTCARHIAEYMHDDLLKSELAQIS